MCKDFITSINYLCTPEHPVLSCILVLCTIGLAFLVASKIIPRFSSEAQKDFEAIPLDDSDEDEPMDLSKNDIPGEYVGTTPLGTRMRRHVFYFLVVCIVLRVEIFRRVTKEYQCSRPSLETTLLPLLLAVYDFLVLQRNYVNDRDYDSIENNVFEDIYDFFVYSRARYLMPTALFSFGVHLLGTCISRSTYVCSSTGGYDRTVPALQIIGTVLDATILVAITGLLRDTPRGSRRLSIIANLSLTSVVASSLTIMITHAVMSQPAFPVVPLSLAYIWAAIVDGITCASILGSINYVMSDFRPLSLATVFIFLSLFPNLVFSSWSNRAVFPPYSTSAKAVGFLLLYVGFASSTHTYKISEPFNNFARRIPSGVNVLLCMTTVFVECFCLLSRSKIVGFYPVGYLMYNARIDSDRWLRYASSSSSLQVAVTEYQSRYSRNPPPNFDKWFSYAQERTALIIDDYDQMEQDLLPFWALEPAIIRQHTIMQHPTCDIVGITIRDGHAEVSPSCTSEESWVEDETVAMINSFAQWLPNMNIAINTKRTPQISVPWGVIEPLRQAGKDAQTLSQFNQSFSAMSEPPWSAANTNKPIQSESIPTLRHGSRSSKSVFEDIEIRACPPSSKIRKSRQWNIRDFCKNCVRPHSIGAFVQDWSLSTNVCHQPDMAFLHTFHMARASPLDMGFSPDILAPVFSRSKSHGYNDIIFPGPGEYIKALANHSEETPFSEKQNTLFWRGTAEHSASVKSWHGGQRQRFVHWVNNYTGDVPMLLPYRTSSLAYESIPAPDLTQSLHIDVAFTNFTECNDHDCLEQTTEFGVVPEVNLEQTRQYKYLFDIDSIGSSGTFLQLLQSNSLPFRASIFRSWFDDRLTPWLHYIPIDIRLHGLQSALAYFAGVKLNTNGRDIIMENKDNEAAFIAGQGRRWAEKSLRQEDAEVYFFRLLLEWGRIVDDNRSVIGFNLEPSISDKNVWLRPLANSQRASG